MQKVRLVRSGIKRYGSSGKPNALYAEQGIDEESVKKQIREQLKRIESGWMEMQAKNNGQV